MIKRIGLPSIAGKCALCDKEILAGDSRVPIKTKVIVCWRCAVETCEKAIQQRGEREPSRH